MKYLIDKIEELNLYVKGSLGITHYKNGWELHSYKDGTLFVVDGKPYGKYGGYLKHKDFDRLIDIAYKLMLDDKNKKA